MKPYQVPKWEVYIYYALDRELDWMIDNYVILKLGPQYWIDISNKKARLLRRILRG